MNWTPIVICAALAALAVTVLKLVYRLGTHVGLRAGEEARMRLVKQAQTQGYLAARVVQRARAGSINAMAVLEELGRTGRKRGAPPGIASLYKMLQARLKGDEPGDPLPGETLSDEELSKALNEGWAYRVHAVVAVNFRTGEVVEVRLFSVGAMQLTSGVLGADICQLDGPSAGGDTFADAARSLLKTLRQWPYYRWMYERLTERDRAFEKEDGRC